LFATNPPPKKTAPTAFLGGAVIGALGGLIGLGGAEFRLPLLIGGFEFPALQAVILNKAMSLIVVASALPFRAAAVPFASVAVHWSIIVNLLAGSLLGAWFGAGWATRLASQTLYRVIAIMLLLIAVILLLGHERANSGAALIGAEQLVAGVVAGFVIGVVTAASRGGGRRVVDSDARSPFWRGYQARGEFVARREPTYDVGRLRAVQPGPKLRRSRRKSRFHASHGAWLNRWELHRRPTARRRSDARTVAPTSADSHPLGLQGLATQIRRHFSGTLQLFFRKQLNSTPYKIKQP